MARKKKEADKEAVKPETFEEIPNVSGSMSDLADCLVTDQALLARLAALGFKSKNPNGMTYREAIMCSQIANAVKGDLKAYNTVVDMMQIKKPPIVRYMGGEHNTILSGD